MSTTTEPGLHRRDHLLGDQARCRLAGDERGGDDDVDVLGLLGVELGGLAIEVVAHLLGVAGGGRPFVLDLDAQELGAHRLDLLADLGPGVERAHHRAEAAGRADGRETGHAGTDDEHLGGRDLAGRGDLAGEERAELVGRLDHRAVAADVGHRGEHVERLGARDARHGVHREGGHAGAVELVDEVGVERRRDERRQQRPGTQPADLLRRWAR